MDIRTSGIIGVLDRVTVLLLSTDYLRMTYLKLSGYTVVFIRISWSY